MQKLTDLRKREEALQTRLARLKDDDKDIEQLNKQVELIENNIEEARAKLRSPYTIDRNQHSFVENNPWKERSII